MDIDKTSGIKYNNLTGSRCYLAGAMDRVHDGGVGWREKVKVELEKYGVIVLNPCNKPIALGREDEKGRNYINSLKHDGKYDKVAKLLKEIRSIDLRMVDVSDFIILNVDISIHMCGSYEELTLANRQKKPCLLHIEQGKQECPNWIFGMIPHEHIFSSWDSLIKYLSVIHTVGPDHKRWVLFNYGEINAKAD